MKDRIDGIGKVVSSLCVVHCALCALMPVAFTALGMSFALSEEAEWGFTLMAVGVGLSALTFGWRKHRSSRVATFLLIGVFGLLASRGIEMAGGDHGGHGEHDEHAEHSEHAEHGEHKAHGHEEHAEEASAEHSDATHLIGTGVGVLAGLFLLFGHVLNSRALRACNDEACCD